MVAVNSLPFVKKRTNTTYVDGDKNFEVNCSPKFVDIKSAQWTYKRDLHNLKKVNFRTLSYPIGKYINIGTWNALKAMQSKCPCTNQCTVKPKDDLPQCSNWDMILRVEWSCVDNLKKCYKL